MKKAKVISADVDSGQQSRSATIAWNKFRKSMKRNAGLYLFLLPTLIWYILFCYFPMGGIYMAFTRYKGIGDYWDAAFVGMKWFESFFNSAYAETVIKNTLVLSLYSLATFPIPIIVAMILNEVRNERFKKISQTIMYAPHFVSLVVMVVSALMRAFRGPGFNPNFGPFPNFVPG